jgi:hypothetical protein
MIKQHTCTGSNKFNPVASARQKQPSNPATNKVRRHTHKHTKELNSGCRNSMQHPVLRCQQQLVLAILMQHCVPMPAVHMHVQQLTGGNSHCTAVHTE